MDINSVSCIIYEKTSYIFFNDSFNFLTNRPICHFVTTITQLWAVSISVFAKNKAVIMHLLILYDFDRQVTGLSASPKGSGWFKSVKIVKTRYLKWYCDKLWVTF